MPTRNRSPHSPNSRAAYWGQCLKRLLVEDSANTQVEYLFMLMLVIFVAIAGITVIGNTTKTLFVATKNAMP